MEEGSRRSRGGKEGAALMEPVVSYSSQFGKVSTAIGGRVWWAVLMERQIMDAAVNALLNVAVECAARGYTRLEAPYTTTDKARNKIAKKFMEMSHRPDDKLVMLDCDHWHPADVVVKLASTPFDGVVGGLYWMRTRFPPGDDLREVPPVMFRGEAEFVRTWTPGAIETDLTAIGTGAICIPRWAFTQLEDNGCAYPWFRYAYHDGRDEMPGEDTYFCAALKYAGVPMASNTAVVSPHLYVWPMGFPPEA